jgi:phospholipase C
MANNPPVSTPTSPDGDITPDGRGGFSLTSDAQPYWDDCSTRDAVALNGTNIGDELNKAGLSWGWFEGGFTPTTTFAVASAAVGHSGQPTSQFIPDEFSGSFTGKNVPPHASNQALCDAVHPVGVALGGTGQWGFKDDFIPHHEPFQYYASTANPHHLTIPVDGAGQDTPAGLEEIGTDTQSYVGGAPQFNTPNHQYDTSDFDQLVAAIGDGELSPSALPNVSFLKAPGYEDGHPAYSEPADEQAFVTKEIDSLMRTPDWRDTVVIVNYDDSDGWYDHVYSGVTNPSLSPADNLTNTTFSGATSGQCGPNPQTKAPLAGEQGRCGFGPRLPMLVISPFARVNDVDHNLTDQASVLNLIEYNWHLPGIPGSADQVLSKQDRSEGLPFDLAGMFDFRHPHADRLILSPVTGQPAPRRGHRDHGWD